MAVRPSGEFKNLLKEYGGEDIDLCYQCGLCTGNCRWNTVRSFSPRNMIRAAQLGITDLSAEETWLCLNCGICTETCPRGVNIPHIMRSMRRIVTEMGVARVPDSLRLAVKNISVTGNPFGEREETRTDWAHDLDRDIFNKESDLLYFTGCLPSYDTDAQKIARATVRILQAAGIDFTMLGSEEVCCGEAVRMSGNESGFLNLAEKNIESFSRYNIRRILAGSAHCFHTFKNEYPELGADVDVVHSTQLFAELIRENKLRFSKELNKKVIYHDSCYLGRHNGIYDEPRDVLRSIPGVELLEFPENRNDALCCGGGSGRVWMETKKTERFSDIKIAQAVEAGADVLAVACPYCLTMFRDSLLSVPGGENIELKDISQLVAEAL